MTNQDIQDFWLFYCEFGTEMHPDDWTFLTQFFKKVSTQGTEALTQEQIFNFTHLFKKYCNEEALDSSASGLS